MTMSQATEQQTKSRGRWLRIFVSLVACSTILIAAAYAVVVINRTEPIAQKVNSARKSAALVETVIVERGSYSPRLVVLGTIEAAQDIVLGPRISGQVVEVSSKLVPGGMVKKEDQLLRLDPADFENAVSIAESELKQAKASREIEQARQQLAEKELKMLEASIEGTNRSLVMREPQIASIEAEVSAAAAAVERAQLDLQRTRVNAPFDAHVLSRSVNIGSQVRPGDELARLIGLDEYWVMAAVPVRSLRWVRFADSKPGLSDQEKEDAVESSGSISSRQGSRVILRNPDVWGPNVERQAYVARMIGTLDGQTRLARVLIIAHDPLGLSTSAPPLILGSLIETEIEGRPIEDVVRLRREHVRDQGSVWVMKDDKLEIREVELVFRDLEFAYISEGLESGDEVVTTTLATVANGVGLRKKGAVSTGDALLKTDDTPIEDLDTQPTDSKPDQGQQPPVNAANQSSDSSEPAQREAGK